MLCFFMRRYRLNTPLLHPSPAFAKPPVRGLGVLETPMCKARPSFGVPSSKEGTLRFGLVRPLSQRSGAPGAARIGREPSPLVRGDGLGKEGGKTGGRQQFPNGS